MDEKIKELERKAAKLSAEITALKAEAEKEAGWPKKNDIYYVINASGDIAQSCWEDDYCDRQRNKIGNVFHTEEQAEERVKLLRWLAEKPERWEKVEESRFFITVSETVSGKERVESQVK